MKKIKILIPLLISGLTSLSGAEISSSYFGFGTSENKTVNDSSLTTGFNINFHKTGNLNLELETSLSLSNNDNNFLDLLPELSYKTDYGSLSIIGGLTVGYIDNKNVYGSTVGTKYTTGFKNHNIQVSYKVSSLRNSFKDLEDIDRLSVNYIFSY